MVARLPLLHGQRARAWCAAGARDRRRHRRRDRAVKPHDVLRTAPAQLAQSAWSRPTALHAVTGRAAQVVGLGDRKGRLAPGYDADILAVDGDPLTDPAALHRIRAVYIRGAALRTAVAAG